MRRYLKKAALLVAVVGMSSPAFAQTSTGNTGSTGATSSSVGASGGGGGPGGGTASSSPGVSNKNDSETGVVAPGDAPVDSRTLQPIDPTGNLANRNGEVTSMDQSGTGSASQSGSNESMETHLGHKAPSKTIRDGLAALHAANRSEIQAGELAEQNASNPEVKAFAQRMVNDHTQADQQLVSMAPPRVDLASKAFEKKQKEGNETAKALQGKTGSAFDQAYISEMVKDHQKDAKEVKTLAAQAKKEGASDWASYLDQVEQTMQAHLTEAQRLQSSIRNTASSSSTTGTGSSSSDSSSTDATSGQ